MSVNFARLDPLMRIVPDNGVVGEPPPLLGRAGAPAPLPDAAERHCALDRIREPFLVPGLDEPDSRSSAVGEPPARRRGSDM